MIALRDYQSEAIEAVRREFRSGRRSTLLILPTGAGKTVVFSDIARRVAAAGGRTLILAHRNELIQQAYEKAVKVIDPALMSIEKASSLASRDAKVVIASVQTLKSKRLRSWPSDHFTLIVIDEAHRSTAESYQKIVGHFSRAKLLGVTATPFRADDGVLADVYESRAFEMDLWHAIDRGILCDLTCVVADTAVDLKGVHVRNGDLDQQELSALINANMEPLVKAIVRHSGNRRTIVFSPSIPSAKLMAEKLKAAGESADYVSYKCPDRSEKIGRYLRGETRIVVNPMLLGEGFDDPETSCVVLARPTRSRVALMQMVGRGTRLAEGKKDCLVVDFAWGATRGDLASLLENEHVPSEQMVIRSNMPFNLAVLREKSRQEAIRREALQRKHDIEMRAIELRCSEGVIDLSLIGLRLRRADYEGWPATNRQLATVQKWLKLRFLPIGLTASAAAAILDMMSMRYKAGLATYRQVQIVKRLNPRMTAERLADLTFNEASGILAQAFNRQLT